MKFKLYRIIVNILAVVYFVFDEVFVYCSNKFTTLIQKVPRLDEIIFDFNLLLYRTNKYIILCYFLVLLVISELIGIYAFIALASGNIILFIILYIVKFIPFFIVNHIFKETKEELLSISWFNFCVTKIIGATEYLKSTEVYIRTKEVVIEIKIKIKSYWR